MKKTNGVLTQVQPKDLLLLETDPDKFWFGVSRIGKDAFADCEDLTKIVIPENISEIESYAFFGCENLKEVVINSRLVIIQQGAFYKCANLKSVEATDGVVEIFPSAFEDCSSLENVVISEMLGSISVRAFYNCSSLKQITIAEGTKKIGARAFFNCNNLTSVAMPNSVENLGVNVFTGCTNLENVTLSERLEIIPDFAFESCANLKEIVIPNGVKRIGRSAFQSCDSLKNITIPDSVTNIEINAFQFCYAVEEVRIPASVSKIGTANFDGCKNIYVNKTTGDSILTKTDKDELLSDHMKIACTEENLMKFVDKNYRTNFLQLSEWKKEGKIKFIPPEYIIEIFPHTQMDKYFANNNNQRWGKLVKTLRFDTLDEFEKNNSLIDLMKIYYALGGFSENQGECEKAFNYVLKHVAKTGNPNATPSEIGEELHRRFSRIELKGKYNPTFAQFFMKYYHDNPDFMVFSLEDKDGAMMIEQDYLCAAHNAFGAILKNYPNRVVNRNEERSLLTPRFVAENSSMVEYDDVFDGNETLATIVGRYGYSQEQFNHIQEVYEKAKSIKDSYVICADKASGKEGITFRVLEKDDPLGFVLGDITNCCQHIGGAGEECVDDGYVNPNAGFLVFEENFLDENGVLKTRILAQAYVWYDPETKTVCYDNIEIPTKILKELKSGEKNERKLSTSAFINAIVESATSIINTMNKNGVEVQRVTTGVGYNDLSEELEKIFGAPEINPIAMHRDYAGYSDAKNGQFLIQTYDQVTKECASTVRKALTEASEDLSQIEEVSKNTPNQMA